MSRALLIPLAAAVALAISAPDAHAGPRVGVRLDVGAPSGAGGAAVLRLGAVRLHAGAGHNGVGPGVQGGVTLAPLRTRIAPTLVLDAGHFFTRDANPAVARLTGGSASAVTPETFAYDYASAHLGLELGSSRLTFYLHGGVSYVRARLGSEDDSADGDVSTMTDIDVRALSASARLGFIIYFL